MVAVEYIQDQRFKCIGGNKPMMGPEHSALIVAPSLDLRKQKKFISVLIPCTEAWDPLPLNPK
jgi:hypothetical protein